MTIDSNDTGSIGVESWDTVSRINGNVVARNGADGIDVGGQNSPVTGNTTIGNGLRTDGRFGKGCGISVRYGDAVHNGNRSRIAMNVAQQVANGPQGYGYCDQSAQVRGVTGEGNRLTETLGRCGF